MDSVFIEHGNGCEFVMSRAEFDRIECPGVVVTVEELAVLLDYPPAEFWRRSKLNDRREDVQAMPAEILQRATREFITAPEEFQDRFAVASWSGASDGSGSRAILSESFSSHVESMAEAIDAHKWARILINDHNSERGVAWVWEIADGIWLKVMPETVSPAVVTRLHVVKDTKTDTIRREMHRRPVFMDAAAMALGALQGRGGCDGVATVWAQSFTPFHVRAIQLDDDYIKIGEHRINRAVTILSQCLERDAWPGHDVIEEWAPSKYEMREVTGDEN